MTGIDWLILGLYFVFVLGIGFTLKSSMKTSTDFFLAGRAIPGMGVRTGVHVGKSGRAGSDRDGRVGREVRDRDLALLLDRRDSGDGVRRDCS